MQFSFSSPLLAEFRFPVARTAPTISISMDLTSSIAPHGNPLSSLSVPPKLKFGVRSRLWSNSNGRMVQPRRCSIPLASVSMPTSTSAAGDFVATVGASAPTPTPPRTPNSGHLLMLNAIACVTAVSASCLFFAAIPTLMAFKRAAESLEKLLDVTREELPGTMAAVRLSGMEISDLTMELSDLGQEITEGVRSSTQAVRAAEDGLRRMTNMASIVLLQEQSKVQDNIMKPAMARAASSLRDGIVQGRSMLRSLIFLRQFSGWLSRYWWKGRKQL